jgi:1-acyl-sn-glycerol-3-phosphate acyltransferase
LLRLHCKVSGMEQLPSGPKILAINHPNVTDGFFFPLAFSGRFSTLIQDNVFNIPVIGWLLSRSEQIPVMPGKKLEAFRKACAILREGHTVMIFPEGRLNPEQIPLKAGAGAVCMSLKTGAPIIPVGVYVADQDTLSIEYWEKNIVHRGRCQIRGFCYIQVGQPWYPDREMGDLDEQTPEGLTEILIKKIYALSSQAALQANLNQDVPLAFYASS